MFRNRDDGKHGDEPWDLLLPEEVVLSGPVEAALPDSVSGETGKEQKNDDQIEGLDGASLLKQVNGISIWADPTQGGTANRAG